MEFYIKKNSTLPKLQVEVINESRNGYNQLDPNISASTVTFSMYDVENGTFKIANSIASVKLNDDGSGYILSFKFTKKNTNRVGSYEGFFTITNDRGKYEVPFTEKLFIKVTDSFADSDMCCRSNTIKITPTPSPTVSTSVTSTPMVSFTPSVTPSSLNTEFIYFPNLEPSVTPTMTPSLTPSISLTYEPTRSVSISVTPTITPTITPTQTVSVSQIISTTPTVTPTITQTITPTVSPTITPSNSELQQNLLIDNLENFITTDDGDYLLMSTGPLPTPTPSITQTQSVTPTPSITQTQSVTPTPSITQTQSVTPTVTVTPSTSAYVPSSRILYYDFNNNSSYSGSSVVFDLEGNSDGTVYNSALFGDCYQSVQFNGTNGYITTDIDLNSALSPSNTSTIISLFTWFYPTDNGIIVSEQGSVTPPDSGWYDAQIQIASGDTYFSVWPYSIGSTGSPVIQSSVSTPLNQWYYLGLTYDGTTLRAYVNGSPAGSVAMARQTPYNNGPTQLHYALAYGTQTNFTGGQPYGVGRMGTFEVYNTALTQTEITNLYNNTSSQWICPSPTPSQTPSLTPSSTP